MFRWQSDPDTSGRLLTIFRDCFVSPMWIRCFLQQWLPATIGIKRSSDEIKLSGYIFFSIIELTIEHECETAVYAKPITVSSPDMQEQASIEAAKIDNCSCCQNILVVCSSVLVLALLYQMRTDLHDFPLQCPPCALENSRKVKRYVYSMYAKGLYERKGLYAYVAGHSDAVNRSPLVLALD